jgi:3-phenylpropionate/trans-cinnamate dioxygenase ferredoxin subunit
LPRSVQGSGHWAALRSGYSFSTAKKGAPNAKGKHYSIMNGKNYTWYLLAPSTAAINFGPNNLAIAEVNNKKITIANTPKGLFACAHACPHAGGIMAQGHIDALGNIVCPLHRYKFSIHNGRNTSGEGYYLKTYPIEQREEGVFIGFEQKGLLNF